MEVFVQIGAADSAVGYGNERFVGGWGRGGDGGDTDVVGSEVLCCFHCRHGVGWRRDWVRY